MSDCVFCKIVSGLLPHYKLFEDEDFFAILDAFPSIEGQVLIFPKKHFEGSIFDLENEGYSNFFKFSKKIAKAIQDSLNPLKVGLVVEGLEVDHLHLKLYPLGKEGLKLNPLEKKPSGEKMNLLAKKISNSMDGNQNL